MRIALPTAGPGPRRVRRPGSFPRAKAFALCQEVLAEPTWGAAVARLRRWAKVMKRDWRHRFARRARIMERDGPFRVFSRKGNVKLPFVSFSTLPVFTCPGMGECEGFCYSFRAWRYPDGLGRQLENTLLLKFRPEAVEEAFMALDWGLTVRLYVDGDFGSADEVYYWMGLCARRPDLAVYGYSKSWDELWQYHEQGGPWPPNYMLNLSSGGKQRRVTREQMMTLPITRGDFIALDAEYRPAGVTGNVGFRRYDDNEYHAAMRRAARALGIERPFSCPGKCGECSPRGHVCGATWARGITVVNGQH